VSIGSTTIQLSDLQNFLSGLNVPAGETTNQRSGMDTFFFYITDSYELTVCVITTVG
jgi:hypothetical protein